jgi:hypothetical protein
MLDEAFSLPIDNLIEGNLKDIDQRQERRKAVSRKWRIISKTGGKIARNWE